jgi:arylsulfatase A-like enzyme
MRLPSRIPAGVQVAQSVSLRDIPATVMNLLGAPGSDGTFPGSSLARYWDGSLRSGVDSAEEPVLSEVSVGIRKSDSVPTSKGPMQSLVSGRYHYIRGGDGREELYDVEADPWEQQDLSRLPDGSRMVGALRAELQSILLRGRTTESSLTGVGGPVHSAVN